MSIPYTVPETPTREQIEAFRREHHITAHLGETPAAGLEPWAVEQNMVLAYLCSFALEADLRRNEIIEECARKAWHARMDGAPVEYAIRNLKRNDAAPLRSSEEPK